MPASIWGCTKLSHCKGCQRTDKQLSKRLGTRGLMWLWDKKRNRAGVWRRFHLPILEVCVQCIVLKLYLNSTAHLEKRLESGLDWKKKLNLFSLSKGRFRGDGSQRVQGKKVEVLMNPLTEKALGINCLKPKLDKFKEVIKCDFSYK